MIFSVECEVVHFTEDPWPVNQIELDLQWTKSWVDFPRISVFDVDFQKIEKDLRSAKQNVLRASTRVRAKTREIAMKKAVKKVETAINLLSVITGHGFRARSWKMPIGKGEKVISPRMDSEGKIGTIRGGLDGYAQWKNIPIGRDLIADWRAEGYLRHYTEINPDIRGQDMVIEEGLISKKEFQKRLKAAERWSELDLTKDEREYLGFAIRFFRLSKMTADYVIRFLGLWTSLEVLSSKGIRKKGKSLDEMVLYLLHKLGINIQKGKKTIEELRKTRNSLIHEPRLTPEFMNKVRDAAVLLERIVQNILLGYLGLPLVAVTKKTQ